MSVFRCEVQRPRSGFAFWVMDTRLYSRSWVSRGTVQHTNSIKRTRARWLRIASRLLRSWRLSQAPLELGDRRAGDAYAPRQSTTPTSKGS